MQAGKRVSAAAALSAAVLAAALLVQPALAASGWESPDSTTPKPPPGTPLRVVTGPPTTVELEIGLGQCSRYCRHTVVLLNNGAVVAQATGDIPGTFKLTNVPGNDNYMISFTFSGPTAISCNLPLAVGAGPVKVNIALAQNGCSFD
jgi:hypothetical protein